MKRKIRRTIVCTRYRLRKMHHKIGRIAEYSHLTYFGVLFVEGWSKTMYAKVGVICLIASTLYLMTDGDDQ